MFRTELGHTHANTTVPSYVINSLPHALPDPVLVWTTLGITLAMLCHSFYLRRTHGPTLVRSV